MLPALLLSLSLKRPKSELCVQLSFICSVALLMFAEIGALPERVSGDAPLVGGALGPAGDPPGREP